MPIVATPASGLVRSLRRWDLIAVVLNGVIGAGIFGLPSKVFGLAGDYSLFAFGACAICVALIVLSFAEVASRFSGTGGPYLYARETYGPAVGFTVGWLVWVARVTGFAANCNLLPDYLDLFFHGAGSGAPRAAIIIVVVLLLIALNLTGVRRVATTSNALAIGKLLPLAAFIAVGLFFLVPSRFTFSVWPGYQPFSQAMLLLVYAFTGFEMVVVPAGETRQPQQNMPAALMAGIATVVIFYVLIQVVCIGTLPGLAASKRPLADAAAHFAGSWGAVVITAGIVISLAGNLNVIILTASRILFAMAERGELPAKLAVIHSRYRTPFIAVLLSAAIMLVLTLSGTFIYFVTISTLARLVTYLITCSALPKHRRRATAPPAMFLAPFGVAVSCIAMAVAIWLLSNSTLREARDTLAATALGLTIYWLHRKLARRRPDPSS